MPLAKLTALGKWKEHSSAGELHLNQGESSRTGSILTVFIRPEEKEQNEENAWNKKGTSNK